MTARHFSLLLLLPIVLPSILCAEPSADQLDRIAELAKSGKLDEARIKIETLLEVFPDDPQLKRMLTMLPKGTANPGGGAMEGTRAGEVRIFGGVSMVWCPAGEFAMGSPSNEPDREDNEDKHRVILTRGFWLAKTETTEAHWKNTMGQPSSNLPILLPSQPATPSWTGSREWLAEMNRKHPLPEGWLWELPTEAQWEYACRAGTMTAFSFGDSLSESQAHISDLRSREPIEVGSYPANAWGLHDMHGNVEEWCRDWFGAYPGIGELVTDPKGPASGTERVVRGGTSNLFASYCRSAARNGLEPGYHGYLTGFRAALVPPGH